MEKRRILIVDNNDELRVLEEALGRLGHEIVVAAEREKALRRNDLDSFDLIISDLAHGAANLHGSGGRQSTKSRQDRLGCRILEKRLKLSCFGHF